MGNPTSLFRPVKARGAALPPAAIASCLAAAIIASTALAAPGPATMPVLPSRTRVAAAPSLTIATPATSPATAPAAVSLPAGIYDQTEVRRGTAATDEGGGGLAPTNNGFDTTRVLTALAGVVALILALRWVLRRFLSLPPSAGRNGAVQILARQVLTHRQQLVVVKIGRRVVVASDNGSQLTALTEITDPDEVASLVGQIRDASPASRGTKPFGQLFGRVRQEFAAPAEPVGDTVDPHEDLETELEDPPTPDDSSNDDRRKVVSAARSELDGLLKKVRMVSDQFGRP